MERNNYFKDEVNHLAESYGHAAVLWPVTYLNLNLLGNPRSKDFRTSMAEKFSVI